MKFAEILKGPKRWISRITGFSTPVGGVSWSIADSERAIAAAQSFREGIIEELNGFYPRPGKWPIGFEEKLRAAVSRIEILVAKFRYFVPSEKQNAYDSDWSNFKSHALDLTWEKCAGYKRFPTMRSSNEQDPKEMFYERTENLLRHANET